MNGNLQFFYSPPLVAYLLMSGFEIKKIDKHKDSKRVMFFFEKSHELDQTIQKWREDDKLNTYAKCLKEVRRMMS